VKLGFGTGDQKLWMDLQCAALSLATIIAGSGCAPKAASELLGFEELSASDQALATSALAITGAPMSVVVPMVASVGVSSLKETALESKEASKKGSTKKVAVKKEIVKVEAVEPEIEAVEENSGSKRRSRRGAPSSNTKSDPIVIDMEDVETNEAPAEVVEPVAIESEKPGAKPKAAKAKATKAKGKAAVILDSEDEEEEEEEEEEEKVVKGRGKQKKSQDEEEWEEVKKPKGAFWSRLKGGKEESDDEEEEEEEEEDLKKPAKGKKKAPTKKGRAKKMEESEDEVTEEEEEDLKKPGKGKKGSKKGKEDKSSKKKASEKKEAAKGKKRAAPVKAKKEKAGAVAVKKEKGDDEVDEVMDEDDIDFSESPLHGLNFGRIILDEAHKIKARTTNTAKAIYAIKSVHKWCLTGTPLQVDPCKLNVKNYSSNTNNPTPSSPTSPTNPANPTPTNPTKPTNPTNRTKLTNPTNPLTLEPRRGAVLAGALPGDGTLLLLLLQHQGLRVQEHVVAVRAHAAPLRDLPTPAHEALQLLQQAHHQPDQALRLHRRRPQGHDHAQDRRARPGAAEAHKEGTCVGPEAPAP
jgi:hypothetical protein